MPSSAILTVLLAVVALIGPAAYAAAPPVLWFAGQDDAASSPAQAAELAKRQTGGKVLSVRETDGGWEVKVLTASGEVQSVFIPVNER